MPWNENPEGTMVETGEDWIDLPDETPEAAASSLAPGDVDPLAPFARDDEFLAAMLEESIAFCGGRETDVRGTLEQTAKCLGLTYEALMQGGCRRHRRRTRSGAGEARASCVRGEELTDEGADRA